MYRSAQRGQSFPKASWNAHGARASSPEPSPSEVPLEPKESRSLTPSGEVPSRESVLALQQELQELRNSCAIKDQKIGELQKSDASVSRLKREIREFAEVLHEKRKELSHAHAHHARLQAMAGDPRAPLHQEPKDIVDTAGQPIADDGDARAQERIAQLQEENRQLRERLTSVHSQRERRNEQGNLGIPVSSPQHRAASRDGSFDSRNFSRPPDNMNNGGGYGNATNPPALNSAMGGMRYPNIPGAFGNMGASLATGNATRVDDGIQPEVYSSMEPNRASTLGQIPLQGVGMVNGASGVAKILLQRLGSSVYHQQGRRAGPHDQNVGHPQMAPAPQLAQPGPGV